MSGDDVHAVKHERASILSPVERVSEILFGLFMALTFTGAVSVAEGGRAEIRELLIAALTCNIAWGLVDGVMYLVGSVADRGRWLKLVRSVQRAALPEAGRRLIETALARAAAGDLVSPAEVEAIRGRIVALADVPARPGLERDDLVAALAIFLLVVGSTFPVVLPFLTIADVGLAKLVSQGIALTMLFLGGLALGNYAGYGSWKAGLGMAGMGVLLVSAISALGG
jgi:VIT1/CCC1 family predicted Fe2+/Mn2+ transporter